MASPSSSSSSSPPRLSADVLALVGQVLKEHEELHTADPEADVLALKAAAKTAVQPSAFGSIDYWKRRYARERAEGWQVFEWFHSYGEIEESLAACAAQLGLDRARARVLNVGAGNSILAEDMWRAGWRDVTSTDIVPDCVEAMRERCVDMPGLAWEVDDCTAMRYDDSSFDLVLDKGTLDAIACAGEVELAAMVGEIARVTRAGGAWLCYSHSPHRAALFADELWRLQVLRIAKHNARDDNGARDGAVDFAYFGIRK